jgi:hypothetical protein
MIRSVPSQISPPFRPMTFTALTLYLSVLTRPFYNELYILYVFKYLICDR